MSFYTHGVPQPKFSIQKSFQQKITNQPYKSKRVRQKTINPYESGGGGRGEDNYNSSQQFQLLMMQMNYQHYQQQQQQQQQLQRDEDLFSEISDYQDQEEDDDQASQFIPPSVSKRKNTNDVNGEGCNLSKIGGKIGGKIGKIQLANLLKDTAKINSLPRASIAQQKQQQENNQHKSNLQPIAFNQKYAISNLAHYHKMMSQQKPQQDQVISISSSSMINPRLFEAQNLQQKSTMLQLNNNDFEDVDDDDDDDDDDIIDLGDQFSHKSNKICLNYSCFSPFNLTPPSQQAQTSQKIEKQLQKQQKQKQQYQQQELRQQQDQEQQQKQQQLPNTTSQEENIRTYEYAQSPSPLQQYEDDDDNDQQNLLDHIVFAKSPDKFSQSSNNNRWKKRIIQDSPQILNEGQQQAAVAAAEQIRKQQPDAFCQSPNASQSSSSILQQNPGFTQKSNLQSTGTSQIYEHSRSLSSSNQNVLVKCHNQGWTLEQEIIQKRLMNGCMYPYHQETSNKNEDRKHNTFSQLNRNFGLQLQNNLFILQNKRLEDRNVLKQSMKFSKNTNREKYKMHSKDIKTIKQTI